MQPCRVCGQDNHEDELFCLRCGQFIERDDARRQPAHQFAVPAPPLAAGSAPDAAAAGRPAHGQARRRGPANRAALEQVHLGDAVCPLCRAGNPIERTFCRGCGSRLNRGENPTPHPGAEPVLRSAKRVGVLRPALAAFVGVLCLAAVGFGAIRVWAKGEATSSCPKPATISRVHAAAGDAFAVKDTRRATGRIVLQFSALWPRTSSGALIVSICQTGGDEYWYFARDSEDAPTGAFVPASVLADGSFKATSPRNEVFVVNGSGLSINGKGLAQVQPLCTSLDKIHAAWEATTFTAAPRCNDTTVKPWLI